MSITTSEPSVAHADIVDVEYLGTDEIIRRLAKYFTISCPSKRNSGKSVLIIALVRELIRRKRVDIVVVMTGSKGLNDDWSWLPDDLVIDYYY
jgi:hypothetical protein